MSRAQLDTNQRRQPLLYIFRGLYRLAYRLLVATGLADLHLGNFSVRRLAGWIIHHIISPLAAQALRGPFNVRGHQMQLGVPGRDFQLALMMDTFERGTVQLFDTLLREGMVVVDVGAHIGFYSLIAARRVGPTGKVYAFEPEPSNYAVLCKNIELNRYRNIQPIQKAVAARAGRVRLYLSPNGSVEHSLYRDGVVGSESLEVDATSLDELWEGEGKPNLSLIRMDIQGGEASALDGMSRILQEIGALLMILEFYPAGLEAAGVDPLGFLQRLSELGFRVHSIQGEKCVPLEAIDTAALAAPWRKDYGVNLLCQR